MAIGILVNFTELDCHKCDDKLKEERGHDKKGIVPFRIENEIYFRCPLTLITSLSWEYIKAFGFYEKNILPNGIGWINESNKYIQAMMILQNVYEEYKNKEPKTKNKRR